MLQKYKTKTVGGLTAYHDQQDHHHLSGCKNTEAEEKTKSNLPNCPPLLRQNVLQRPY
jgi:hypothetical protein